MSEILTFEDSWTYSGKQPMSSDKFWRFRPPTIDPKADYFGVFHYSAECCALLDSPLTEREMVALYYDLQNRARQSREGKRQLEEEMGLLAINTMDLIASRIKSTDYSEIASSAFFKNPKPIIIEGLKIGDRYREADLVYPSFDWPRTVYVKGKFVATNGVEASMWIGPQKVEWHVADVEKDRSGVWVESNEGVLYFWFFDKFADSVTKEANQIRFKPNVRLTPEQNLKIVYK